MNKQITDIIQQKKNPNRVNIYVDNEYAFGLSRLIASKLQIGQSISNEEIEELQTSDISKLGFQKSLNFLRYRPRSEYEVRRNLLKHDFSQVVIENVIKNLEELNLINDKEFASLWVDNRSEFNPKGRIALVSELRAKGIDEEIIDETLSNLDEESLAKKAAEKKSEQIKNLDWEEYQKILLGYLLRRGFTYHIARPIVHNKWNEIQIFNEKK
jgi:regulatory protein